MHSIGVPRRNQVQLGRPGDSLAERGVWPIIGAMSKGSDYIYTESQCDLIEGAFTYQQGKWRRSFMKRAASVARAFSRRTGRLRERVIEYPLTITALGRLPAGSRVADLGGASGLLALQLVYLGLEVHVLDLRAYPMRHPQLTFNQQDIFDSTLDDNYFDGLCCISVIEHAGIARYGSAVRPDGQKAMLAQIKRLVRPDGLVVLSAPYGQGHDPSGGAEPRGYRIYDRQRLAFLLDGFDVDSLKFFRMANGCWLETEQTAADEIPPSRPIDGIFWSLLRVRK